jgi:hypothetical protein
VIGLGLAEGGGREGKEGRNEEEIGVSRKETQNAWAHQITWMGGTKGNT